MKNVTVTFTPAQARVVNEAMALFEDAIEDEGQFEDISPAVLERAWTAISRAMQEAGVDP